MINLFKSLLIAIFILISNPAFADTIAFTQTGFHSLQKEGKPILIEVHAPWCPTCRAQAPIINEFMKKKEYQSITVLRVDFDDQKDILKLFNVNKQSTLIAFKGSKEVARSIGDTSPTSIENLLKQTL